MGGETKFACGMGGGKGQEFIPNTRVMKEVLRYNTPNEVLKARQTPQGTFGQKMIPTKKPNINGTSKCFTKSPDQAQLTEMI